MSLSIRPAAPDDAGLIHSFICELAEYEKLGHEVVGDEAMLADALFRNRPRVFCVIAEWDDEPAGFALWFYTFSTFRCRHGMYLEDLYVRPALRGHGIGKALLIHLVRICRQEGLARFEWSVLDWNTPSIEFYKALGAVALDDWMMFRMSGNALDALAGAET